MSGITLGAEYTEVIQEVECTGATLGAEYTVRVLGIEDGRTVLHPVIEAERRYPTGVRDIGLHIDHVPVNEMVEGSNHLGSEVRGVPDGGGTTRQRPVRVARQQVRSLSREREATSFRDCSAQGGQSRDSGNQGGFQWET